MARNKGTFKFGANFEVQAAEAFDPRVVVETRADLINKETWPYDGDTIYVYNGMIVGVANDKTVWMLVDKTQITSSGYEGWKQIDASSAITIGIVDNVTTDDPSQALSARQGKVLNDKITDITGKLTAIFTYKGTKATWTELEAVESPQAGDVWNLEEAHENVPAGTNWVWNGSAWDALAGTVDLSGYVQKEPGKELISTEKLTLIDTNASDIANLKLKDTELEGKISTVEDKLSKVKSYYEVPAAVLALTAGTESGEILSAVGGNWNNFIAEIKKAQPIVAKKQTTGTGTENDLVISVTGKYDMTDSANDSVSLIYLDGLNEHTIKISRANETYSVAITDVSIAKDSELKVVQSTADSAVEAILKLNGEVGEEGSVKHTATQIATTIINDELSWVEVSE